MFARISPHQIAGCLLFLPATAVLAIWYVYLCTAPPPGLSVAEAALSQLRYSFSQENAHAWWFAWMIGLPIACTCLGVAYLLHAGRTRTGSIALVCCVIALAIATFFLNGFGLALLVAAPALSGYRGIRDR